VKKLIRFVICVKVISYCLNLYPHLQIKKVDPLHYIYITLIRMSFNSYRNLNFNYDALCKSDISETKFTFVWEISKMSSRLKDTPNGEYLKSEGFQIKGPGDKVSRMNVKMFPNGETAK